jgi:poly-gamma-glutamate synthesis protein (capsule biosynthesis protein)
VTIEIGDSNPIANLVFTLAAPFPTIVDDVDLGIVQSVWTGTPQPDFGVEQIIVSDEYLILLSNLLGEPNPSTVLVLEDDAMLDHAWENQGVWAFILFDQIEPKWKVIVVDDQSPIRNDFNAESYPLNISISLNGEQDSVDEILDLVKVQIPRKYIHDEELMTTVIVTGVTAMARGTAWEMDEYGVLYPAEYIGGLLKSADITHISNEVPFVENCPEPSPYQLGYVFCSDPSYIELLEFVGTDIVELTGDHFGDYSSDDVLSTFAMYEERGWQYYGAGVDIEAGRQAITMEHNGNKIAFIGCNGKGDVYTPTNWGQPGSVECDYDWLVEEIARLKSEGYLVISTFQHEEIYSFKPWSKLKDDFRLMAEAGADIVSGSQAHQPHGVEFSGDSLMMFGLGNLFFDLIYGGEHLDEGLIARHVFYNNEYISTEIFTIKFISYSQPRLMTESERDELLKELFEVSGWQITN